MYIYNNDNNKNKNKEFVDLVVLEKYGEASAI